MNTYKKQLVESGLTGSQATVYELLIRNGGMRASSIVRQLNTLLSRPMVYAVLGDLIKLGLVEKNDTDTKVARFFPAHPSRLQEIVARRQADADSAALAAASVIPRIVSDYNLISEKPGVRFFEGKNGISMILRDSLSSQTPILSYIDVEIVENHYADINIPYMQERERRGILKKLLLDDTPFVRNLYKDKHNLSEVRLITRSSNPFPVSMQIYDDKVTYLTLIPGKEIGIIIENASIAGMHRHLFEELYERASIPLSGAA